MVLRVWFQEIFLEVIQLFDLKLSLYVYVIFLSYTNWSLSYSYVLRLI